MVESARRMPGAFLYQGHGNLKHGALRGVYDSSQTFRSTFNEADRVVERYGFSVTDALYGDNPDLVTGDNPDLRIVQATTLTLQVGVTRVLRESGIVPGRVNLGHSFGQYGAGVGAEILPFPLALELSVARGFAMNNFRAASESMVGLVDDAKRQYGRVPEMVQSVLDGLKDTAPDVAITVINHGYQVLIGGEPEDVSRSLVVIGQQLPGVRARPYPAPFSHSPLCEPAQAEYNPALKRVRGDLQDVVARVPVLSDVKNQLMTRARSYLSSAGVQMKRPVVWEENLAKMARLGVREGVEVGAAAIFARMAEVVCPQVEILPTNTDKALEVVLGRFGLPRQEMIAIGSF